MPDWPSWTIQEAADATGYNPEYLRRLCRANRIEYQRIGQMLLIRRESLLNYIATLDADDARTGPRGETR